MTALGVCKDEAARGEIPVGRDPKDTQEPGHPLQNAFSAAVDNPFGPPSLILNGR